MPTKKQNTAAPPAIHRLDTPNGAISYQLARKRVKNLNLRVSREGLVSASAPNRMPLWEIEAFITKKSKWILETQRKLRERPEPQPSPYSKEECLALFTPISDAIYPLFADLLGGEKPTLRVREMTSRWGVCHVAKRTITLNTRLAEKPKEVQEYVILHEYVHFLHPNHQAGFHAEMARLMPDYKQRRKLLR